MVLRENVQRRIVISCNVAGRDLGSVVDDIQAAISQNVSMPAGYRVEYGGQFESEQSASRRLLALGVLAIGGLFLLLVLAFGRPRDALIVMVNLPLALITASPEYSLSAASWMDDDDQVHHAVQAAAEQHHARLASAI